MFYVYMLIDPRNDLPFYIGKGKNKRCYDHFSDAKNSRCYNKHLEYKIKKIWQSGFQDITVSIIFETLDENEAHIIETENISKYGRIDLKTGPLVNLTGGGEGFSNRSEKSIKKNIDAAMKTKSEWTEDQYLNFIETQSRVQTERWANMSEEDKLAWSEYQKNRYAAMTPGEKLERADKCKETFNNLPPDKKENVLAALKQGHKTLKAKIDENPEWWSNKVSESRSNMSDEQKGHISQKAQKQMKNVWANMTPEARKARCDKISAIQKGKPKKKKAVV